LALGPERLRQNDVELLKKTEALIDKAIENARPGTTTVYVTPPADFSSALMPAIEAMYQKAGWRKVEHFSDQRDGNGITLSM
jgi:hypothetical protein